MKRRSAWIGVSFPGYALSISKKSPVGKDFKSQDWAHETMTWSLPVVVKHKTMPQFWMVEKENKQIQVGLWTWAARRLRTYRRCGFFFAMSYEHNKNLHCQMGSGTKPQTLWCCYAAQLWQNHNDVSNELKGKKKAANPEKLQLKRSIYKVFFKNFFPVSTSKLFKIVEAFSGPLLASFLLQFKSLTDYANDTDSTVKWANKIVHRCRCCTGFPM